MHNGAVPVCHLWLAWLAIGYTVHHILLEGLTLTHWFFPAALVPVLKRFSAVYFLPWALHMRAQFCACNKSTLQSVAANTIYNSLFLSSTYRIFPTTVFTVSSASKRTRAMAFSNLSNSDFVARASFLKASASA